MLGVSCAGPTRIIRLFEHAISKQALEGNTRTYNHMQPRTLKPS
jgi:hypothetical protein